MRRISRLERLTLSASAAWLLVFSHSASALAEGAAPRALEVTAGLAAQHRSLKYHDTPAQLYPERGGNTLLTYNQPLAPAVFVRADLFPFALSMRGPLAHIGLSARYEMAFETKAVFGENTAQEARLTSESRELLVGLRGRLPLGAHELGLDAGYGQHRYTLVGDAGSPLVPDVDYEFARFSADARFRFEALSFGFHVGTRLVRDTGALRRDWFPETKTQVLEGGLLLGYQVAPHIEVVTGFDVLRYAFDFNPIPSNADPTYVAGGAVDQYLSGWLGARFSWQKPAAD